MLVLILFFSSRRRHTRSLCDWSSDVCSSDLRGPRQHDNQRGDGKDPPLKVVWLRSEERRVGKECRFWWLSDGYKKNGSGGIQGDVVATESSTVGMGEAGSNSAIQGSNVPNSD